ncbi:MAG: hypothetical protein CMB99_11045 [Flavobacteriaceae bacterium]|nr:hypothetical protein [Flavobacteriaceae bacterium]|tara:strand:- start:115892 stop:116353 length:462 start_codon:yes stop_codon:yes gene_type:complete
MKSNKLLNIAIAIISVIGIILFVRVAVEDKEALESSVDLQNGLVSPLVYYSTYLLYASVIIALVLSMISLVRNPDNLKKTLMGLAVLGVIFLISYFTADSAAVLDTQGVVLEGGEEGSTTNQMVGTGIWYSVFLGAIASVFFVWDLVKGLVKS